MKIFVHTVIISLLAVSCSTKTQVDTGRAELAWVMDEANLLSAQQEDSIATLSRDLEAEIGSQVAVLIINNLAGQSIEEFSLAKANYLGLGRASHNDGILITVALADRKVRIEVGEGLENIITDEIAAQLISDDLAPHFVRQRYTDGIYITVDKISTFIRNNKERIGRK